MNDDPDKMSERGLRLEVKNLRERLAKVHDEYRIKQQAIHDEAFREGYDKGFPAGAQHEKARILRELEKMK